MESIRELIEQTFKKYGWTDEQQNRFRKIVREKMATNNPFALKEYGNTGTPSYEKRVYLVYQITDVIPMDEP